MSDSLLTPLPGADVVVSAPPLGVRLAQPFQLMDGSSTVHMDVASVDACVRSLKAHGRAVLQVSPGFVSRTSAERYRHYLATNFRVAALIGCPPGSIPGSGINGVILVIDRDRPGQTFVAQIGEDWETQLSREGAALTAARAHVDEQSGGRP